MIPGVDPTSPIGIRQIEQRRTELICEDLDRLVERHNIGRSDVLLINSLRHWSIEAVVNWLEGRGLARAPTVILVLHYTPHPNPGVTDPAAKTYESAFRRIDHSELRSRILLCTDSDRLRGEYRSLYNIPITVLPVPHCSQTARNPRPTKESLSIAFAGEARQDKGFHLLPEAIRRVLDSKVRRAVTFEIQTYRTSTEQEVAEADLLNEEAVHIHPEPLGEKEYESFIEKADIILLPYLPGPYQAQTSGVYCEAAALGVPVVVSEGTWAADEIAKSGGGVLFEGGDAVALANACLEAIETYPHLLKMAEQAAPAWRAFHNPQSYVAHLEALLESVPAAHAA